MNERTSSANTSACNTYPEGGGLSRWVLGDVRSMRAQVSLEVPVSHQLHHHECRLALGHHSKQTHHMVCVESSVNYSHSITNVIIFNKYFVNLFI